MKKLFRAITVASLIFLAFGAGFALPARAQDFVMVWEDEFDGTEVDTTRWSFQIGDGCDVGLCGWGNNEKQWYLAENATVADGLLTITAKEEQVGGRNYTSARMRTLGKGDWTFGRFEMRAQLPEGQGFWPAFWMLPSDESIYGVWAASGEIDIMENIGSEPQKVFGTIHYGGPSPGNVLSSRDFTLGGGSFADDFHVFAVEWESGEIRWYVDELLYAVQTNWFSTGGSFPAPFDVDFHLLLNLAVGGNLPGDPDATTVFPQAYVIDYVRVFQAQNEAPTVAITSPADGVSVTPGTDLVLAVEATDTDGTVERVEFYQGEAKLGEDTDAPFEWTVPAVAEGCYVVSARATDNLGGRTTATQDVTVGRCMQAPYLMTPVALPGRVEAENYDLGGPGTAYNDTDASNNGNAYRAPEGVDIERTQDAGFGFNVGWIENGEWLDYQVDVQQSGTYNLDIRVASLTNGGSVRVLFDGVDKTGPIAFSATGGWQDWETIRTEGVMLDAGVQTMRVEMLDTGFNLNHLAVSESVSTATEDPAEVPSWVRLGGAYPNPFSQKARFDLTVEQTQRVRVELFDLLGRSVAVLHDGLVRGQEPQTFTIDGSGFSNGLYVYRVMGETFAESRRVLLVK